MRYIFILMALLCASCGTTLPTIKPYKLDVQQGNVVTSKMLLQLRPGMTKSQVRFIMGTPLIQDSFHGNRWDYVYQMREGGKIKEQRRVILDFENDLLKSVRGDVIAAGSDQSKANETEAPIGTRVVTPIKKPEQKGLLNKLKFWEKDEAELAKEAAEKEAAAKAKLQAEEAAKNAAAAKQNKAKPVPEAPKSLPIEPIAVPAVESPASAPADAAKVEPAPAEPTTAAPNVVEPTVVQTAPVVSAPPAAVPAAEEAAPVISRPAEAAPVSNESAPVEPSPKSPNYESSSGMVFDRKLQSVAEEPEPAPAVAEPRAGNKVPPKPRELPQESDPSFFDRILEQIGF